MSISVLFLMSSIVFVLVLQLWYSRYIIKSWDGMVELLHVYLEVCMHYKARFMSVYECKLSIIRIQMYIQVFAKRLLLTEFRFHVHGQVQMKVFEIPELVD